MKKTSSYKSIQLLIIVFFISCANKNNDNLSSSLTYEFETIDNDFNLFSGNTLIQDTNDSNYIYFYSANPEKINFVKKDTLYPFDIIKINQLLSQDVINFYEIQLTELSELKKKVLFESENFKSKKDSLSKLEHNLLNTLFCFQKKYDCNDKYSLEIKSFDLTSILKNNSIKWPSVKLIYTPKDEETALHIEDNCNEIYINLFARLKKKDISEKLSFEPLRVELFDIKSSQKINGTCSFQQSNSSLSQSNIPPFSKSFEEKLNKKIDTKNQNQIGDFIFNLPCKLEMVLNQETTKSYTCQTLSNDLPISYRITTDSFSNTFRNFDEKGKRIFIETYLNKIKKEAELESKNVKSRSFYNLIAIQFDDIIAMGDMVLQSRTFVFFYKDKSITFNYVSSTTDFDKRFEKFLNKITLIE